MDGDFVQWLHRTKTGTSHTPGGSQTHRVGAVGAQGKEGSTVQTDAILAAICNLQPVKAKLSGTFILSVCLL